MHTLNVKINSQVYLKIIYNIPCRPTIIRKEKEYNWEHWKEQVAGFYHLYLWLFLNPIKIQWSLIDKWVWRQATTLEGRARFPGTPFSPQGAFFSPPDRFSLWTWLPGSTFWPNNGRWSVVLATLPSLCAERLI